MFLCLNNLPYHAPTFAKAWQVLARLARLADICQPVLLGLARLADIRQPVLLGLARLSHICQRPFLKKNVTRLDTFARVMSESRKLVASAIAYLKPDYKLFKQLHNLRY
jgi:hypothetical protein